MLLEREGFILLNHSSFLGVHNGTQTVNCIDGDSDGKCGLIARYSNSSNYYKLYKHETNNFLNLTKTMVGINTSLNITSIGNGNVDFSLVVNGTNLSVYVQGILKASVIDTYLQNYTPFIGIF